MEKKEQELYTKLPVRITGIVFWGLVLVGLLASVIILHFVEQQIRDNYISDANTIAYEIEEFIETSGSSNTLLNNDDNLKNIIKILQKKTGFTRVNIKHHKASVDFGKNNIDDDYLIKSIRAFNVKNGTLELIEISIYFKNQNTIISSIRKNMLLITGLSLFLLWYLFQYVLQRILSRPFMDMVQKADRFTHGNEDIRFDEDRNDEFGYLGKFINNAIESILSQRKHIQDALDRATKSEIELGHEKERAEVTLYSITDAVITIDMDEKIQYLNPAAEALFGASNEETRKRHYGDILTIVDDRSGEIINDPIQECYSTQEIIYLANHSAIIGGNSTTIAIEASVAPMKTAAGDLMGAVVVIQDVSHTRRLTRQLSHQASHDMLTGLYNRRKFEEHMEDILSNAKTEARQHSFCYLDLDQFKIINDTCGHVAGDELLRQLPVIFKRILRSGDVVARLGGDEFGILLENCNIKQAADIADKILKEVKDFRFDWEEKSFEIGASIGVVEINRDNTSLSKIMSSADIACYVAKDSGRNRIHVYESSDAVVSERYGEMHWISRITKAIEDDRFVLYKQSIVSTSGKDPGHIEILLRMLDENNNIIPPSAFMPAAERYNLMKNIDRWVITKTFECIKQHRLDENIINSGGLISINLSGESINDDGLLEYILSEKDKYHISLKYICFEITETVAIRNLVKAMNFINDMKNHGCSFALDDFGSGLSSFTYLKSLPVEFLKIDGSFVKHITHNKIDEAMVIAIQQIGKVMDVKTVAEWVEDKAILDALTEIGVDYVQGYYLNKPEPIDT